MRKHLLYLPLMLTAALGCSVFERVKEKSGVVSDPRRGVAVAQGLNHAAADPEIYAADSLFARLPNETEVFFGAELEPSTPPQLAEKLARAAGAAPAADGKKKTLYVAAAAENRFGSLADLFRLAQENGYGKFRLVVRPAAYSPFDHALTIEAPDEWVRKAFPVIADTAGQEAIPRPNPNTLLVEIDADARTRLNKDERSPDKLSALLFEVFRQRELYGVFREGTNEVEKTVFFKAARELKYADAVRVIDALAQSGSDKIVVLTSDVLVMPEKVMVHTAPRPRASRSGNSGK